MKRVMGTVGNKDVEGDGVHKNPRTKWIWLLKD
jgi:hypothetical protein